MNPAPEGDKKLNERLKPVEGVNENFEDQIMSFNKNSELIFKRYKNYFGIEESSHKVPTVNYMNAITKY